MMTDEERDRIIKQIMEALDGLSPLEAQVIMQTALDEAGIDLEVIVDPVTGKLVTD